MPNKKINYAHFVRRTLVPRAGYLWSYAFHEATMRIAGILFLSLLLAGTALGQDTHVVTDTLDWHRYYPLEIGNTWEYGGLDAHVRMIVGDTLANGRRYFIRRDSIPAVGTLGPFINTFYLRYDTAGTVVTLLSLEADTVAPPLPFDHFRADFPDVLAHFDMRSAFGDTLYYRAPDTLFYVQGGYNQRIQVGNEYVEVDALKCFGVEGILLWAGCYAADVGFVRGGNLSGSELKYAEVNGVVYGSPLFTSVETEAVPEQFGIETIYPNPFRDKATITWRLPKPSVITVEVFDVLGRRIWWERTEMQAAGAGGYALRSRAWPAGMYLVRLTTERGAQSVRTVVVAE
ncbi:T9SS type A sorting domain-containing protein [Rhodocaloribacter sp.]